jgi:hypothetical protein
VAKMSKIPVLKKLEMRVHRQYILKEAEHFRDHKKGVPEWIKNSDDSYVRHEDIEGSNYSRLPIILNFSKNEILCLDFGGSDGNDVLAHVPYYGSPYAAKQGKNLKREVSGGHGNGGKYYGLSQFDECQVINYFEGKLTMLTLKREADEVNYENNPVEPSWLIKFLYLDNWPYFYQQKQLLDALKAGKLNLFCWRGTNPKEKMSNPRDLGRLLEAVTKNPQARSALSTRIVDILLNGKLYFHQLLPIKIELDTSKNPKEFILPNQLGKYTFNKTQTSILKVSFSKEPLTGESSSLNILEIFSNGKPIGFYNISSMLFDKGVSRIMYAEIDCPELKEYNCVSNDRMALVDSPATDLFLNWCKSKLQEVLTEQTDKEMKREQDKNLDKVSEFIDQIVKDLSTLLEEEVLTQVYNKNSDITATVLTPTDETGGFGTDYQIRKKGGGKRKGKLAEKESPATNKPNKSQIRVFISNHDPDPLNPTGATYNMLERQPVLNQRQQDVPYGYWWINSQKEYLKKMRIEQPAARAVYCFLIKEVFLSSTFRKKYKDEPMEHVTPDALDDMDFNLIDRVFNKVVSRLSINIIEENQSEKLRTAIRAKEKFTIPELSEELGIDPTHITSFILQNKESILKLFRVVKGKNPNSNLGPQVNIYIKK